MLHRGRESSQKSLSDNIGDGAMDLVSIVEFQVTSVGLWMLSGVISLYMVH